MDQTYLIRMIGEGNPQRQVYYILNNRYSLDLVIGVIKVQ